MTTEHIVSLLVEERDRLEAAIAALQGAVDRRGGPPKSPSGMPFKRESRVRADVLRRNVVKRTMSTAARKRIGAATKARWAAIRAAKKGTK
jgi:hypothetical protein